MLSLLAIMVANFGLNGEEASRRAVSQRSITELFSSDDYPADAIARGVEGVVGVRLTVGPDGRVSKCEVVQSADESLDRVTCARFVERGLFNPARDARGQPTEDIVNNRVRWVLPADVRPFAEQHLAFVYDNTADVPRCAGSADGQSADLPVEACRYMFGPFADMASRPDVVALRYEAQFLPSERATASASPEPPGELLWRFSALVTVAPDGTIAQCTTTISEPGSAISAGSGTSFDPCVALGRQPFEAAPAGRGSRQAVFKGSYSVTRRSAS